MRALWIAITVGLAAAAAAQLPGAGPQFDFLANDLFVPTAEQKTEPFVMQGKVIPDDEVGAIHTSTNVPNLDASIMLSQAGVTNLTNAVLVAWRKQLDGAVVTGQSGTNYIAGLLYRDIRSEGRPWRRSFMYCIPHWIGREYDHPPTLEDVVGLASFRRGYIFREPPK